MGWFLLVFGVLLLWIAWDAWSSPFSRRLTNREVSEKLYGPGAPELTDSFEIYARAKLVSDASSSARLITIVFSVAGAATIVLGLMLLLE
jgi:hypothetical protein